MKESKTYAYISIVAMVAIVALFVMSSGSGSKETYQPTFSLGEADLIGDARHIVPRGTEIDRLAAEPVIKAKKSDFALVDISRIPKLRNGCTPLSQDWFNTLTADALIVMGQGCVALVEDVTTSYSLAIQGNLEFFGEGYQITMLEESKTVLTGFDNSFFYNVIVTQDNGGNFGYTDTRGFEIYDHAQIHNSVAENVEHGFRTWDSAEIYDSTATNVFYSGFELRDSSLVKDSLTDTSMNSGFRIFSQSTVENSVATNIQVTGFKGWATAKAINCDSSNNKNGFSFYGGEIINSVANHNELGFRISTFAQVHESTATNNDVGFELIELSSAYESTATNNVIGFDLRGNAQVHESTATNNEKGFLVTQSSNVYDSISSDNYIGFELRGDSSVYESTATNNEKGFLMFESSSAVQSTATNNAEGFELRDTSSIYGATAADNNIGARSEGDILSYENPSITGGHFCDNTNRNLVVNGGILSGTIITSPTSGFGAYNGNPTLISCGTSFNIQRAG